MGVGFRGVHSYLGKREFDGFCNLGPVFLAVAPVLLGFSIQAGGLFLIIDDFLKLLG